MSDNGSAESSAPALASPEELAGRLFEAAVGGLDILTIYLGERLGYYQSLDADGPATAGELARRTGTHYRQFHRVTAGINSFFVSAAFW